MCRHTPIRPQVLALLLALPFLASWPGVAIAQFASIRHVGNTNDCDYSTVQAAINAAISGDTIKLQGGQTYTEHLTITDKSLTIGTALCTPPIGRPDGDGSPDSPESPEPAAQIAISGSGGANTAVLTISGNSAVTLQNLSIRNGHASGNGGGIAFNGRGSLTLLNTAVFNNTAAAGAGIEVNGSGGHIELVIGADTLISANKAAGAGGGMRVRGDAHLLMDAPSGVWNNQVLGTTGLGDGGGLQLIAPAQADIGSPGLLGFPAFLLNSAVNGGGIATQHGGGSVPPLLRLYTTDPLNPLVLDGNTASNVGGGVYLRTNLDSGLYHGLFTRDVNFVFNSARNGAAIYIDEKESTISSFAEAALVSINSPFYASDMPSQSVRCAVGIVCNQISGNVTQDINGNRVNGAIVYVSAGAWVYSSNLRMQNNQGAQLIFMDDDGDGTVMDIYQFLMTDNDVSEALVHKNREAGMYIFQSTVSRNQIGGPAMVVADQGAFFLKYSIVDQPFLALYSGNNAAGSEVDHVLTQDAAAANYGTHLTFGTPFFIDSPNGDYRLYASRLGNTLIVSKGIDVGAPVAGDDRDIDNRPFDQDVVAVPNGDGVRDLGALEAQPIQDRIFVDGFGDEVLLVN
ncbi:MAG: hypothetical protein ABIS07_11025 [Dokdonella sp.]